MADFFTDRLKKSASFPVDIYCEGYPDVVFEIILDAVPTQAQATIAVEALTAFANRYNTWHFVPIHYVSNLDCAFHGDHPRGIYVHIDFGSACPLALLKAMKVVAKLPLPIFRVALI